MKARTVRVRWLLVETLLACATPCAASSAMSTPTIKRNTTDRTSFIHVAPFNRLVLAMWACAPCPCPHHCEEYSTSISQNAHNQGLSSHNMVTTFESSPLCRIETALELLGGL